MNHASFRLAVGSVDHVFSCLSLCMHGDVSLAYYANSHKLWYVVRCGVHALMTVDFAHTWSKLELPQDAQGERHTITKAL